MYVQNFFRQPVNTAHNFISEKKNTFNFKVSSIPLSGVVIFLLLIFVIDMKHVTPEFKTESFHIQFAPAN